MSDVHVLSLTITELAGKLADIGLEPYRTRQIWEWIHRKGVLEFSEMSNLPKDVRQRLQDRFGSLLPPPIDRLEADDGTVKIVLVCCDDRRIEAVAIPEGDALTFCLSCQIGCPVACTFCRTGRAGFSRNVTTEEIIMQYAALAQSVGRKPTNIVFMGMGEPLLNRPALFGAIDVLTNPKGQAMASRRLTISTVGILDGINELADRPGEVNLAVSLHTVDATVRTQLIPMAKRMSLTDLRLSILSYLARTNRRVTFEWVLLRGVNDQESDALNLAQFCEGLTCHVNLVRYNLFPGSPYRPSTEVAEREFRKVLKKAGIPVTVRASRGGAILAACGQLANS